MRFAVSCLAFFNSLQAGRLCVFIRTHDKQLIEVHPQLKVPPTYDEFRKLMGTPVDSVASFFCVLLLLSCSTYTMSFLSLQPAFYTIDFIHWSFPKKLVLLMLNAQNCFWRLLHISVNLLHTRRIRALEKNVTLLQVGILPVVHAKIFL